MRTILIVSAALVGLGCLVVPNFKWQAKQSINDVGDWVNDNLRKDHPLREIESRIRQAEEKIRQGFIEAERIKVRGNDLQAEMEERQHRLADKEVVLKKAKSLLEKSGPGSVISIGGADFAWEVVNQDALNMVGQCEVLRKQIAYNKQSLAITRQAYTDCISNLNTQQQELARFKIEFEAKKAEYYALKDQAEIAELVKSLQGKITGINSDFDNPGKVFNDTLEKLRAERYYDKTSGSQGSTIPWDREMGFAGSAASAIDAYLKGGSKPQPKAVPAKH